LFAYDPADATAIPKPHHVLPHLNPDWFTFLVPAYSACPRKEAIKQVYNNNNNNDRLTAFDPGQPG